jgi:cyclic pyranopterin monophosphate synthase
MSPQQQKHSSMAELSHINANGEAHMVDVSGKEATTRVATAIGAVKMLPATLNTVLMGDAAKGDVIGTARLAGIMAAKRTSDLIPLCHPLMISKVTVEIEADEALPGFRVSATVKVEGKTGVEMEALTAVSVACLTIYDMAKALEKGMAILEIRLTGKTGGKSGDWKS